MAKKTYTVLDAIRLDGEDIAAGAAIDLEDKQAKPLLDAGAIEAAAAEPKAKK